MVFLALGVGFLSPYYSSDSNFKSTGKNNATANSTGAMTRHQNDKYRWILSLFHSRHFYDYILYVQENGETKRKYTWLDQTPRYGEKKRDREHMLNHSIKSIH